MIDWLADRTVDAVCPVCGRDAAHRAVLASPSMFDAAKRLTFLACDGCGSGFFDDRQPPAYEGADGVLFPIKFYVEKGAGIDSMLRPIAAVPFTPATRYLEIGCGFGFSLDFVARHHRAQVLGIDPGGNAAQGRRRLGLDIVSDYFGAALLDRVGVRDVVYCSELIEHIEDPGQLLTDIAAVLAPDGMLVLTTPAVESVEPAAPAGALLPTLSPGSHLILYSAGSLEMLLRRHGFTEVRIVRDVHTLIAHASRGAALPPPRDAVPADALIDYLAGRYAASSDDALLRNGFLFRLVKHLVIAGRFAEARALAPDVEAQFRDLYGIDVTRPDAIILPDFAIGAPLPDVIERLPLNLANHLHFRGLVDLVDGHDGGRAAEQFMAAARLAGAMRDVLHRYVISDGELEAAIGACLKLTVFALRTLPADMARSRLPPVVATLGQLLDGRPVAAALGPEAPDDLRALAALAGDLGDEALALVGAVPEIPLPEPVSPDLAEPATHAMVGEDGPAGGGWRAWLGRAVRRLGR
jgi:SAM-dependent methyltransferase